MEKTAVIGFGCVGLPLAVTFGEKRPVVGFDINGKRIDELKAGEDIARELSAEELAAAPELSSSTSRVRAGTGPHFAAELVKR